MKKRKKKNRKPWKKRGVKKPQGQKLICSDCGHTERRPYRERDHAARQRCSICGGPLNIPQFVPSGSQKPRKKSTRVVGDKAGWLDPQRVRRYADIEVRMVCPKCGKRSILDQEALSNGYKVACECGEYPVFEDTTPFSLMPTRYTHRSTVG